MPLPIIILTLAVACMLFTKNPPIRGHFRKKAGVTMFCWGLILTYFKRKPAVILLISNFVYLGNGHRQSLRRLNEQEGKVIRHFKKRQIGAKRDWLY